MKKYLLNGEIADFEFHSDFWDFCSPKGLREFLDSLGDGEKAEIEINSPGGDVFAGVEMANMIKNSKADLTAHVTGIAASMASVVACACAHIKMEEASFMMIHDPWSIAVGNAEAMRKEADLLDQCKDVIMSFYRGKFNRTDEELRALMSDETWYTGAECQANGLDCEVVKSDIRIAAKLTRFNIDKMPEAAASLYSFKEIDPETKAAIDKAKAEQAAPQAKSLELRAKSLELRAKSLEPGEENLLEKLKAESSKLEANLEAESSKLKAEHWEARYKGASKKINELQSSIATATEATATLKSQLDEANEALASAKAECEQLKAKVDEGAKALEAKDKDLAQVRDSLAKAESEVAHLKEARQLLTGGVLTPSNEKPLHGKALIRSRK